MFKERKNETLFKLPGEIDGQQFQIRDLENCSVYLLDHSSEVTITRCKGTKFFIGPVKSQAKIKNCQTCEITVVSQNISLEQITNSQINFHSSKDPEISDCQSLTFAPYNFKYSYLKSHAEIAGILGQQSSW